MNIVEVLVTAIPMGGVSFFAVFVIAASVLLVIGEKSLREK